MKSCKARCAYGLFSAAAFALALLVSQSSHAAAVLHYSFDDAGDLAANSAGADGTIVNGVLAGTAGVFGGAGDFTGNAYIEANGLSAANFPTQNATMTTWVKDNANGTSDGFINFGAGSNSHHTWGGGNDGYFNAFRNPRINGVQFEGVGTNDDHTQWHHLAIVRDQDNDDYIIYWDGNVARAEGSAAAFHLGAQWVGRNQGSHFLDAALDEFWMFDQALTAEEVNLMMNNNNLIPEPGSLMLTLIASLGGLALRRRRRRN